MVEIKVGDLVEIWNDFSGWGNTLKVAKISKIENVKLIILENPILRDDKNGKTTRE